MSPEKYDKLMEKLDKLAAMLHVLLVATDKNHNCKLCDEYR